MTDVLADGMAWLESQRREHLSTTVVYERDGDSLPLPATIGRTEFEIEDTTGVLEKVVIRDFLIAAADLVFAGSTTLPERGDLVRETVGSEVHVHEVVGPGGEPAWRYADPYRNTLRIHTKHVSTE